MEQTASQQAITPEQKEFLIEEALKTEAGRMALASSMANPIRLTLDYQGIGRKLLVVDPLPQGALPVYDKDKHDVPHAGDCVSKSGYMRETLVVVRERRDNPQGSRLDGCELDPSTTARRTLLKEMMIQSDPGSDAGRWSEQKATIHAICESRSNKIEIACESLNGQNPCHSRRQARSGARHNRRGRAYHGRNLGNNFISASEIFSGKRAAIQPDRPGTAAGEARSNGRRGQKCLQRHRSVEQLAQPGDDGRQPVDEGRSRRWIGGNREVGLGSGKVRYELFRVCRYHLRFVNSELIVPRVGDSAVEPGYMRENLVARQDNPQGSRGTKKSPLTPQRLHAGDLSKVVIQSDPCGDMGRWSEQKAAIHASDRGVTRVEIRQGPIRPGDATRSASDRTRWTSLDTGLVKWSGALATAHKKYLAICGNTSNDRKDRSIKRDNPQGSRLDVCELDPSTTARRALLKEMMIQSDPHGDMGRRSEQKATAHDDVRRSNKSAHGFQSRSEGNSLGHRGAGVHGRYADSARRERHSGGQARAPALGLGRLRGIGDRNRQPSCPVADQRDRKADLRALLKKGAGMGNPRGRTIAPGVYPRFWGLPPSGGI